MRKWLLALLGVVIVAGVAVTAAYMLMFRPAPAPEGQPAPPQTATIVRTNLSTSATLTGSLGYGTVTTFTGRKSGTVTWLPTVGTVVHRDEQLYAVDAKPVPLFLGDTPLYRTIDATATPGPDIAEVNANLRALGYDAAPKGDAYTTGTAEALKRWQGRHGLDATGTLGIGDVAVLPAAVRVDSLRSQPGAQATADLLGLTSTTKLVTATVDPTQVDIGLLTPGRAVSLSLPGGRQATGTITALNSSGAQAQPGSSGTTGGTGQSTQQTTLTIAIGDQSSASGIDSGPVGVTVPTGSRDGVLAVPVGALVVVQGGAYAVQVVTGHTSMLVGVRTGMFADGLVEVSGQGIIAGLKVVTVS